MSRIIRPSQNWHGRFRYSDLLRRVFETVLTRWTGADGGLAFFAYVTNFLTDLDNAIIVDLEPTPAIC